MPKKFNLKSSVSSMAALAALLLPAAVRAQDTSSESREEAAMQSDNEGQDETIVVTGTLIRGIAPTGTNVIGVDRAEIVESGVSSSTDLLANIPQLSYFGSVPRANQDRGSPVFFPNLRNLGATGGQNTLMLVDGRRLVGQGILSSTADPTVIPPVAIERVDVIPDGGSSIYGSDAIGGVINFITRRRFNGIEASARYGFADDYNQADGDIIARQGLGHRLALPCLCLCLAQQPLGRRSRLHDEQPSRPGRVGPAQHRLCAGQYPDRHDHLCVARPRRRHSQPLRRTEADRRLSARGAA
ncbi:TonB-dependent receptor plug domain-containing protein [Sphingopyxis sp. PET50]|uniref:TonB-dependent receptor plug domain-containing protein n=1 Tax=Sphingopyxis sp. PET50 TaxID=2976533 RepID=UPI0028A684F4|nr:TonB-dependent receptor plug domain-containing protein [Sphingopyxis sp. PET50]